MGIDNRDADGGQKQQGGDLDSGRESRQVNQPDKSINPNGQRERGSESEGSEGGGTDANQSGAGHEQNQGGSGRQR